jgi:hypothetical protein
VWSFTLNADAHLLTTGQERMDHVSSAR